MLAYRVDAVRVYFLTSNRELMPAGASSRQRSAGSNPVKTVSFTKEGVLEL